MKPISVSQIRDLQCPAYYNAKRNLKLPEQPSEAMLIGRLTHLWLEGYIRECVRLGVSQILDHVTTSLREDKSTAIIYHKSRMLLKDFAQNYAVPVNPAPQVEVQFALDEQLNPLMTPTGECDWDAHDCWLRGRFDQLQAGGSWVVLTDFKTGFRILSPDELHEDIQSQVYALAAHALIANAVEVKVQFVWLRYGCAVRYAVYHEDDFASIADLVACSHEMRDKYQADDEWPEMPCMLCHSCRYPCKVRDELALIGNAALLELDAELCKRRDEARGQSGLDEGGYRSEMVMAEYRGLVRAYEYADELVTELVALPNRIAPQSAEEAAKLADRVHLLGILKSDYTDALKGYCEDNGPVVAMGKLWEYRATEKVVYSLAHVMDFLEDIQASGIDLDKHLTVSGLRTKLDTKMREGLAATIHKDARVETTTKFTGKKL